MDGKQWSNAGIKVNESLTELFMPPTKGLGKVLFKHKMAEIMLSDCIRQK